MTAPADRLLAAADLLDKQAGEATKGPWRTKDEIDGMLHGKTTVVWAKGFRVVTVGQTRKHHYAAAEANVAYIATVHPEVGKAQAAMLRVLGSVDYPEVRMGVSVHTQKVFDAALALADALLLAGES